MLKLYKNQEERNEIQLLIDESKLKNLSIKQGDEDYVSIFINPKNGIIKQYVISAFEPNSIKVPGLTTVHLGSNVPDEALKIITSAEISELSMFPIYDLESEILSIVRINIEGVGCHKDENTGKWVNSDGSKKYKFQIKVVNEDNEQSNKLKTIYVKHQEPKENTVLIENKRKNKVSIENFKTITLENLSDEPQTFKVKATLIDETENWLVGYINVI